jgi:alanine racemase
VTPSLPPEPPRSLRLDIDAQALGHNWCTLDRLSGKAAAGAAVKANAYGLGVDAVVPVLREAGCRDWFVAHWSEVAAVLGHVAPQQLSVLHGPIRSEDAQYARAAGVRPVLNSMAQVDIWLQHGGGPCDLMVDTGMSRLGVPMDALGDARLARLDIEVLMSHLASADEDSALNESQLSRFAQACALVPARRRSLANSAGIVLGDPYHHELTRPGLSLYGGVPRRELKGEIRQVAHLSAALIQCRDLKAGDTVGYNATFVAHAPMRIGVVSLGYADGFLRCWGEQGWLTHGDLRLPLVGRVSMDMIAVDLSAAQHLREGDWLTVPYALPEAARLTGLTQYELLTLLGSRFAR